MLSPSHRPYLSHMFQELHQSHHLHQQQQLQRGTTVSAVNVGKHGPLQQETIITGRKHRRSSPSAKLKDSHSETADQSKCISTVKRDGEKPESGDNVGAKSAADINCFSSQIQDRKKYEHETTAEHGCVKENGTQHGCTKSQNNFINGNGSTYKDTGDSDDDPDDPQINVENETVEDLAPADLSLKSTEN